MTQLRLPIGALVAALVLTMPAMAVADQSDDLLKAIASSIQLNRADKVDALARLQDYNQQARQMSEQMAKLAAQSEELGKQERGEIEQQIKDIKGKVAKLKEQQEKQTLIEGKMEALLPKIMEAVGQDQSAQDSEQVLAAVSQDRAKAARLIEAVQQNRTSDVGNLLGQGAKGAKIDLQQVNNADGATVVFRIGSLIHCVSTKAQCSGKSSSLTKGNDSDRRAGETVEPVRKALLAADKLATDRDKAIAEFLAAVSSESGNETLSQQYLAELQRLLTKATQALSASSTASAKIASAIDALVRNVRG